MSFRIMCVKQVQESSIRDYGGYGGDGWTNTLIISISVSQEQHAMYQESRHRLQNAKHTSY